MLQHALFQIEIGLWVVISLTTVTLGIFSEKSFSRLYFRPHIILKWIRLVKQIVCFAYNFIYPVPYFL